MEYGFLACRRIHAKNYATKAQRTAAPISDAIDKSVHSGGHRRRETPVCAPGERVERGHVAGCVQLEYGSIMTSDVAPAARAIEVACLIAD